MRYPWVLFRVFWACVKWDCVIRFVPYRYWRHHLLARCQPSAQNIAHNNLNAARALIQITEKVARHYPLPINCLRRCMVQYECLADANFMVQIQIGVRFTPNRQLEAHSWLLCADVLINDAPDVINTYTLIGDLTEFLAHTPTEMIK